MNSDYYIIKVCGATVAEKVPIDYALIIMKAIIEKFYYDADLSVTIERVRQCMADVE